MKIILDLCGGTGAWSRPYADAGYDVRVITLPTADVRLFEYLDYPVHGILAAPPCTYFCRMRMCRGEPTDKQFLEGLSVVDACLRLSLVLQPVFWCIENPQGYLKRWLGDPVWKFDPADYGDPWTKRTWLWGRFNIPEKQPVKADGVWMDSRTAHPKGKKGLSKRHERSVTPPGFAKAFFEANR